MVDLVRLILGAPPRRVRAREQPSRSLSPAERRAEKLLMRCLTAEQRESYRNHGRFQVNGRDGSRWTIDAGAGTRNVTCVNASGARVYCTYLPDAPRADTLLVQKLCIEATGGRGLPRTCDGALRDAHLFQVA